MPWFRGDEEKYRDYEPPRMTDEQMLALERFIAASSDASEFAKKAIIWALRNTDSLTKRVALSVQHGDYGRELAGELQDGAHDMLSVNCKTRLDLFLQGMGTKMALQHHWGCFVKRSGDPFDGNAEGRTIWFSYVYYDRDVVVLETPLHLELDTLTRSW